MNQTVTEYVGEAIQQKISLEKVHFIPAQSFSPYIECASHQLNRINVAEDAVIEVNPLYRYGTVFSEFLSQDLDIVPQECKNRIFDSWIHTMIQIDQMKGLTLESFYRLEAAKEILDGVLGEEIGEMFSCFSEEEQELLLISYVEFQYTRKKYLVFRNILGLIFHNSFVHELDDNTVLVYPGVEKSWKNEKKQQLLVQFFLPLETRCEVYWEVPFGIFDEEETVVLDEIEMV